MCVIYLGCGRCGSNKFVFIFVSNWNDIVLTDDIKLQISLQLFVYSAIYLYCVTLQLRA